MTPRKSTTVSPRYVVAGSRGCYTVIDKQRNDRRVAGPYSWDTAVRACAAWNAEARGEAGNVRP